MGFIILMSPASARPQAAQSKAPPDTTISIDKAFSKAQAESVRAGRRARVRSLPFTLSGEARGFRDQVLRARSLAKIADALWDVAAEQGRILFREAWDAAMDCRRSSNECAEPFNLRGVERI